MMNKIIPIFLGLIVLSLTVDLDAQQFKQAEPGAKLSFPNDHGAHPNYQTEWWYFTGQLFLKDQRPFKDSAAYGFQLTFFRRAKIASDSTEKDPRFDQSYLAHAAISDLKSDRFLYESRPGSDLLALAGADQERLNVWNRNWSVVDSGGQIQLNFDLVNKAHVPHQLQLEVSQSGNPILHGEMGFSRKSKDGASIYYSLPRLQVQGKLMIAEEELPVFGYAWMDHEFMTSSLSKEQVGWDWISLMRDDGSSIMLFKVRGVTPEHDFYSGTVVKDDRVYSLKGEDFELKSVRIWRSPQTGGIYPVEWRISIPKFSINEEISALLDSQEILSTSEGQLPLAYWEGAVANRSRSTIGYLEMTGYAKPLAALTGGEEDNAEK